MSDYYLEDLSRLNGQPKKTIGDYVERNGVLVPRRFASVEEALEFEGKVLVRSEMTQDYHGLSGYGRTFRIRDEIENQFLDSISGGRGFFALSGLSGVDFEEAKMGVRYSLWEEIEGDNLTVVADDCIQGRYHVIANMADPSFFNLRHGLQSYCVVENGYVLTRYGKPLSDQLQSKIGDIVDLYEQVRNLDHFDPDHCPIIELQHHEGSVFFLQYHRGRDSTHSGMTLKPNDRRGVKAHFVRGATSKRRELFKLTVVKYDHVSEVNVPEWTVPDYEEGALWNLRHDIYDEVMARRRRLQVMNIRGQLDDLMMAVANGHVKKSTIFKPEISLVVPEHSLVSSAEVRNLTARAIEDRKDQFVYVAVSSDGNEAYIERVKHPRLHQLVRAVL